MNPAHALQDASVQEIQLELLRRTQHWCGEVCVHDDREEIDRALGVGGIDYGLVSVWWD